MATSISQSCYGSCEGWRHYGDPDPDGRASVAGDGPYRYAARLSELGFAGAGGLEARPTGGSFVLLQGAPFRSDKSHLARFSGSMPVYKTTRKRTIHLAFGCR